MGEEPECREEKQQGQKFWAIKWMQLLLFVRKISSGELKGSVKLCAVSVSASSLNVHRKQPYFLIDIIREKMRHERGKHHFQGPSIL